MKRFFSPFPARLLLFALFALLAVGCRKSGPPPPAAPAPAPTTTTVADTGDLKLRLDPRKTKRKSNDPRTVGENQPAITAIITELNGKIALPFDLLVSFSDCEEANAFYDPETHELVICHELIDEYYELFGRKIKDRTKLDQAVRGATASTFFHELGHALIDAWKLPITGKEEDAADQLSNLVLINRTGNGEQMALDGALSFQLYADMFKGEKKIYWDEHSLDEQRFYDTLCMLYGHDPAKYQYLIKDGSLPEERAEICPADYERIDRAWRTLLAPFLKSSPPK